MRDRTLFGPGAGADEVLSLLDGYKAEDVPFSSGRIMGSMCTAPHPLAVRAHVEFQESNLGNPGLCPGTVRLEKEVIGMIGSVVGMETPNGVVLSGGTEANITAMYLAKCRSGGGKVIFSRNAHFSVLKAVRFLGLEPVMVGLDERFRMDVGELEDAMDDDVAMIHAVAGSTELGAVDDVGAISRAAGGAHVHVDAAFGGFVLPFMPPGHLDRANVGQWDMSVKGVSTMTVDPHKMGLATIPSGCLLYRDESALGSLHVDTPYLTSPTSFTLAGTRGSGAVAGTWAVVRDLGRDGYMRVVSECLDVTAHLRERLEGLGLHPVVEPVMNILAVGHPDPRAVEMELRKDGFYISMVRDPPALRFVVMPHLKRSHIDAFLPYLESSLSRV